MAVLGAGVLVLVLVREEVADLYLDLRVVECGVCSVFCMRNQQTGLVRKVCRHGSDQAPTPQPPPPLGKANSRLGGAKPGQAASDQLLRVWCAGVLRRSAVWAAAALEGHHRLRRLAPSARHLVLQLLRMAGARGACARR